jgi:hypothetical protein
VVTHVTCCRGNIPALPCGYINVISSRNDMFWISIPNNTVGVIIGTN